MSITSVTGNTPNSVSHSCTTSFDFTVYNNIRGKTPGYILFAFYSVHGLPVSNAQRPSRHVINRSFRRRRIQLNGTRLQWVCYSN